MRCNGVIFDLDGTLVDTLVDIANATNRMLESYGFPQHPVNDYRSMVGQGARHLVRVAMPGGEENRLDEALRRFREYYSENLLVETMPYPDIPDMLEALQAAGIKLAVLSNKPHDMVVRIVESLFRKVEFLAVFGQRQGVPRKPDPTSALEVCMKLRVTPGRCAMVGDTEFDMKAGRNAGMFPIGVLWGFHPEDSLRDAGAALLAPTPEDIIRILVD